MLDGFAAIRTINKVVSHRTPTVGTSSCVFSASGFQWRTLVIEICIAVVTDPKGYSPLYSNEGDEKKT